MRTFTFHIIRTARDGIDELDRQRNVAGISQMRIAAMADDIDTPNAKAPDVGQKYYRMFKSGTCKLPDFLRYWHALGYEVIVAKREDVDGKP